MSNPFDDGMFDDLFGNTYQPSNQPVPAVVDVSTVQQQYNDLEFNDFLSAALTPVQPNVFNQNSSFTDANYAPSSTHPRNFNELSLPHLNGDNQQFTENSIPYYQNLDEKNKLYSCDFTQQLANTQDLTFYRQQSTLHEIPTQQQSFDLTESKPFIQQHFNYDVLPQDESLAIKDEPKDEFMPDDIEDDDGKASETGAKGFEWDDAANERLQRLVEGEDLQCSRNRNVWQRITQKFNQHSPPDKPKLKREQIYQHHYHLKEQHAKCTIAEKEVVQALLNLNKPDDYIIKFLDKFYRDEAILQKVLNTAKEGKFDEPRPGSEEEDERRLKFRRKIMNYVKEEELANTPLDKIISQVKMWMTVDAKVARKMHTVQPIGRPKKQPTLTDTTEELANLLRPFRKAYRWRNRVTYHPGDSRKFALNCFALHRLLGAPFEFDLMAKELAKSEADEGHLAVNSSPKEGGENKMVASITRCLMSLMEARQRKLNGAYDPDKINYYISPDNLPPESLLPPTLHTVAGIRGLLLHRKNLANSSEGVSSESCIGNPQSDDKLMRCMLSLFYWPMRLCLKMLNSEVELEDNSDGESDSDEEKCWHLDSVAWPQSQ